MEDVLAQITKSTRALCDALDDTDLDAPSLLPGWSRLTIACHLRYGAEAMRRMTVDTLVGKRTSYYPEGRAMQRPGTLVSRGDEDVIASFRETSSALDVAFATVSDWSMPIDEPEGVFPTLDTLPVLRLTEIEVHGTDLGIGLGPWSDVLVHAALSRRLARLQQRAPLAPGAWIVGGVRVGDDAAPEVIDAPDRDVLALLLGRIELSESFSRAYPGP